jgi:hypothetical protein
VHGRVLIVSVDNAPANALGAQVRTQLRAAIETADTKADSTGRRNTFDRGGVYGTPSGLDA